jgi:hypothetical protein
MSLIKSAKQFTTAGFLPIALLVALLALVFSLMGQQKAYGDHGGPHVGTSAEVVGLNTPPNIECKWELPDMDSAMAGIQYLKGTHPPSIHDDDPGVPDADPAVAGNQVPCSGPPSKLPTQPNNVRRMIHVTPNLDDKPEAQRIQLWMAVDHPNGISNITDVYWQIFHPLGDEKLQVHGTKLTTAQCDDFGSPAQVGTMWEAAVHSGQVAAAAITDINKGMIAKCQQAEKALYFAEFPLSKDQPCGEYRIEATAVGTGGVTDKLSNTIKVFCVFALKIDFTEVNWGTITPGLTDIVSGDLIFDSPSGNAPTVTNAGNDGMGLKILFTPMVGAREGKVINVFNAKFGRSPSTLLTKDPIAANTEVSFGTAPAQVLCANELGKLDLSLHPPANLPADTYEGEIKLTGFRVPGECIGNKHMVREG